MQLPAWFLIRRCIFGGRIFRTFKPSASVLRTNRSIPKHSSFSRYRFSTKIPCRLSGDGLIRRVPDENRQRYRPRVTIGDRNARFYRVVRKSFLRFLGRLKRILHVSPPPDVHGTIVCVFAHPAEGTRLHTILTFSEHVVWRGNVISRTKLDETTPLRLWPTRMANSSFDRSKTVFVRNVKRSITKRFRFPYTPPSAPNGLLPSLAPIKSWFSIL